MERKFGTVLVMCVVLEVVLCAPILEFESVQSLEEVSTEINLAIKIFIRLTRYFNNLESINMLILQGLVWKPEGKRPLERPRRRREDIMMDLKWDRGAWSGLNFWRRN